MAEYDEDVAYGVELPTYADRGDDFEQYAQGAAGKRPPSPRARRPRA